MAKVIRVMVDAEGNVTEDFLGFVGNECETEDHRLRQRLAEYGLSVEPKVVHRKKGVVNIPQRTAIRERL